MGFSEETSGDARQSQVALAGVVSFMRPGVNDAKGTLLNLNLSLIQRLNRWMCSMLSCTCDSFKSRLALSLKWLLVLLCLALVCNTVHLYVKMGRAAGR